MPEMDGFQLMEELRALDPEVDVIFMTGSIHEIDAKLIKAIRKDAFYFLQKPFDRGVLLSLVERCLELKRLDRSNRASSAAHREGTWRRASVSAEPASPGIRQGRRDLGVCSITFPAPSLPAIFMIMPQFRRMEPPSW